MEFAVSRLYIFSFKNNAPPYRNKKDVAADFNMTTNTLTVLKKTGFNNTAHHLTTVDHWKHAVC